MAHLTAKEPILFYDELRVDGVLLGLKDTRMRCVFEKRRMKNPFEARQKRTEKTRLKAKRRRKGHFSTLALWLREASRRSNKSPRPKLHFADE